MEAPDDSSPYSTEFTLTEIVDMDNLYKELGDKSLNKDFCETVASTFSCSANRNGKSPGTWKQVHSWFKEKLNQPSQAKFKAVVEPPMQIHDLSDPSHAANRPSQPLRVFAGNTGNAIWGLRRKGKVSDVHNLAFEAKSARDYAWYDVASVSQYNMFILLDGGVCMAWTVGTHSHTQVNKEVRVRFAGFDNQHDEWVNVRTSVRERSIPVEPSECGRVNVGDLLLCFQEREDQALYCDAHVVTIKRGDHDHKSCNCVFLVHFDHDNTEEPLGLEQICRRPDE